MTVLHVAAFDVKATIGAGRASYYWKQHFESKGHQFLHIGMEQVGPIPHILLFGWYARKYMRDNRIKADVIIAHEPASGFFCGNHKTPVVLFSHGTEERGWESNLKYRYDPLSAKAKAIPMRLRFYPNSRGFRHADLVMLSNKSDLNFVSRKFGRRESDLYIFHNGYFPVEPTDNNSQARALRILFNASWIRRKGTFVLIEAVGLLVRQGYQQFILTLAGVGSKDVVLSQIPPDLHRYFYVIERFQESEEREILRDHDVFILPSFYEGQSLALTQAMAAGKCCVVSDNSGQIDFIEHNVNGLLFETGNASQFAERIAFLLDNPASVVTLGEAARKSVAHLSWPQVTKSIYERISEAIKGYHAK